MAQQVDLSWLAKGLPNDLPKHPGIDPSVPHAPRRPVHLGPADTALALKNALRYFPERHHATLGKEFAEELSTLGHIYMHRFRPTQYPIRAHPVQLYPAQCTQAASIMVMIQNNLDPAVAQFPHELITYGGNGSAFSNWAQYHLVMKYLCEMTDEQTLVAYSGHPMGLFPSHKDAPRMVITNGMVIPNYSSREMFERMYAQGVSQYGQMTAGSFCYIGPQGIVHGTMITILNAARKYLQRNDLGGLVYVSSGLGGMSGAQPKAATIAGCVSVTAEVDRDALDKRHAQGWVQEVAETTAACIARVKQARNNKEAVSIGFHGNVVALWEALAEEEELLVELGSDQTSLHNPYMGGYYPVQLSFEEARAMMRDDPAEFKVLVQASLRRHVSAVNKMVEKGMRFWDYGNAFLVEAFRAGANIMMDDSGRSADNGGQFRYPSYVQDIMGDIFSLGFGPFRWVCMSGKHEDLLVTDAIAAELFEELMPKANDLSKVQYEDNLRWIKNADQNKMVVGSQARILYSNCEGRAALAVAFNNAIKSGRLSGPVVLSRDHHDVSGTDSPYRETSNIYDGSQFCADMAIQNVIGDAARGATWVSIHNGGGVGWGEVMNGGFGMVLDGSEDASRRSENMLHWDVCNGVARRSWAGNDNAMLTIGEEMKRQGRSLQVTMPNVASDEVIASSLLAAAPPDGALDLLLTNVRVATMTEGKDLYGLLECPDACVGIKDGIIAFVGAHGDLQLRCQEVRDMKGMLVTPGLVDCHTHLVFGGDRSEEWELKLKGASYEEVAQAGGGIVNTVAATRAASVQQLVDQAQPRLQSLLREGVTTIEIKSGYGLDAASETKMLQAADEVGRQCDVRVVKTFLGAHALPSEYGGRPDEYIDEVVVPLLPLLQQQGLVDAVDAFLETIGFDEQQVQRVFDAAKSLGLPVRLHGDQLHDLGSGRVAAQNGGLSCDHCEYTSAESAKAMGQAGTVAVLLPVSNYFINETKLPPVQAFREHHVHMAVASNCNPGSGPCASLLLALNMACTRFRMSPDEALAGVTINAARALGLEQSIGSIEVGKAADLCVWRLDHPRQLAYQLGVNSLDHAMRAGKIRSI